MDEPGEDPQHAAVKQRLGAAIPSDEAPEATGQAKSAKKAARAKAKTP
jgi:hypothetical protein